VDGPVRNFAIAEAFPATRERGEILRGGARRTIRWRTARITATGEPRVCRAIRFSTRAKSFLANSTSMKIK